MRHTPVSRALRRILAHWRTRSLAFATLLDWIGNARRRLLRMDPPLYTCEGFKFSRADLKRGGGGNYHRTRALFARREQPGLSPPRILMDFDPASLRPPLILATLHMGVPGALSHVLERLPAEALVLTATSSRVGPNVRHIPTRGTESLRVRATMEAIATLRRGKFVLVIVDLIGTGAVPVPLFDRVVQLRAGAFVFARLANTPILPLVSHWRGNRVHVVTGDPIPPGDQDTMACAFGEWLEDYLREHPGETSRSIAWMLGALGGPGQSWRPPTSPEADLV